MSGEVDTETGLSEFEARVVEFFCDGVRLLGLPKSIGEIYGLLFVSPEPLSLDDLMRRLGISKGSVSQGLKTLRELGAVREVDGSVGRRIYYEPDVELKQLTGGFIKEQIRPHLKNGEEKLSGLRSLVREMPGDARSDFYAGRLERLGNWTKRARVVLPLLQKMLGR
jgi:DNA-binding transcriptional regulator GbsR (MarR family)